MHFEVHCSTGTYIRSLAHDFGAALNCGAYLKELRRTKIGNFSIEDAKKAINNVVDPYALKSFKYKNKTLNIREGKYGPYIMISGKRKRNVPIPRDVDLDIIDLETVLGIIAHHNRKSESR